MAVLSRIYMKLRKLQIEYYVKYTFKNGGFPAHQWPNCNGEEQILEYPMQLKSILLWWLSLLFTKFHVEIFRVQHL